MQPSETRKCTAVLKDGTRCDTPVKKGLNHCGIHYEKAKKMRHKYKKIWPLLQNINIDNTSSNTELSKAYSVMNKALELRIKHRKYAFVPECYDEGHNFQLEMVQDKINQCEKKLSTLYEENMLSKLARMTINCITWNFNISNKEKINIINTITNTKSELESNIPPLLEFQIASFSLNEIESNHESDIFPLVEAINNTNKVTKKRTEVQSRKRNKKNKSKKNKSKHTTDVFDKYIAENEKLRDDKLKLVQLVFDIVAKLIDKEDLHVMSVALFVVGFYLNEEGFFDEDYAPHICGEPGCTECSSVVIETLFCECGCVFKNKMCLQNHLFRQHDNDLKMFCTILLKHKQKLQPVIKNLQYYYNFYGTNMLFNAYNLTFDTAKNKMVLEQFTKSFIEENNYYRRL